MSADLGRLAARRLNIGAALRDPVIATRVNLKLLSSKRGAIDGDLEFALILNQDSVGASRHARSRPRFRDCHCSEREDHRSGKHQVSPAAML
jgi:hypothetical protein